MPSSVARTTTAEVDRTEELQPRAMGETSGFHLCLSCLGFPSGKRGGLRADQLAIEDAEQ